MKPYKLPRRVKGKRTNKLQIMEHGYTKVYRQGSLELEERAHSPSFWISIIPSHPGGGGWWEYTDVVPLAPELFVLAFLARYKNHSFEELLDIREGLQRTFDPFEKGGY